MMTDKEERNITQLCKAIMSLKDEDECRVFLEDVATIKELIDLSARLEIARMLDEGAVFSVISRETGASSATISRVNKCLNYGGGGYRIALGRISKEKSPEGL